MEDMYTKTDDFFDFLKEIKIRCEYDKQNYIEVLRNFATIIDGTIINEIEHRRLSNITQNKDILRLIKDYFCGNIDGGYSREEVFEIIKERIKNTD